MARERLPDTHQTSRRRKSSAPAAMRAAPPTDDAPRPSARDLLLSTWAGRLFLVAAAIKVLVALWRMIGALPTLVRIVSSAATLALIIAVGFFVWRLFVLVKRRLLWRV